MEAEPHGVDILGQRITRRSAIKSGGIAAMGLAFSKPVIETINPRPAFAQLSPPPTEPAPPLSCLVSWWPGDGNANDIIGNNHGMLMGGAGFGGGQVGQGFSFNGTGAYMVVPDDPSLNITGDVTVVLWAKRTVFDGTWGNIISKGNNPITYRLDFEPGNNLAGDFEHQDSSDVDIQGPVVNDSRFHHYAYVRQFNTHRMPIDGVVVVSESFSGTAGDSTGQPLLIGVIRPEVGAPDPQYFGGVVDEVILFNCALSDDQIREFHQSQS